MLDGYQLGYSAVYMNPFITARNEVGARSCFYMCLWSVNRWGGSIPACLVAGLQGGGIPACFAGLQAHTQEGSWGVWPGEGVSRPTPRGEVEGSSLGGFPGPHLGRSPGPHPGVGLQAHTLGESPGPHLGWGYPSMHPLTGTASDGTHPTGMQSCLDESFHFVITFL